MNNNYMQRLPGGHCFLCHRDYEEMDHSCNVHPMSGTPCKPGCSKRFPVIPSSRIMCSCGSYDEHHHDRHSNAEARLKRIEEGLLTLASNQDEGSGGENYKEMKAILYPVVSPEEKE